MEGVVAVDFASVDEFEDVLLAVGVLLVVVLLLVVEVLLLLFTVGDMLVEL